MNTRQLQTYLNLQKQKNSNINAIVLASDQLPKKIEPPIGFIINLQPSSQRGNHWVALFIDEYKNGVYLDSFGLPPTVKTIKKFISENCVYIEIIKKQLQQNHSNVCGKYAAVFLVHRFYGNPVERFIKYFNSNLYLNDMLIERLFYQLIK
jgi:hypothetical protein